MKSGRFLLWLLALLVAMHCFITMVTMAEFHVLDQTEFRENLDMLNVLDSHSKGVVHTELVMGRWNGKHGENLAMRTIVIDVLMGVIIGFLIVKSYSAVK